MGQGRNITNNGKIGEILVNTCLQKSKLLILEAVFFFEPTHLIGGFILYFLVYNYFILIGIILLSFR